jgi:hypothetical protein
VAGSGKKHIDEGLILAMAAGGSVAAAAKHAGCGLRTAYRRLEDPEFRARVAAARADLVQKAVGKLSALGGMAADTLQELLKAESETVRLGASRGILENMFRGVEIDNLRIRLERLEAKLAGMGQGGADNDDNHDGATYETLFNGQRGQRP